MAKTNASPQKTATQGATIARPKQIVPPADFIAHGVSPIPNAPAPVLTNHGGTVLQNVQVVPIYWGAAWASGANAALPGQLDAFFDFILTSSMMDLLGEYSLPGKPIQHGSRLTSVHVPGSEPGTPTPTGRLVTDAQIQTQIQTWISSNTLPATTPNTLYFVYLPPNVVCDGPAGAGASCSQFCGYHDSFGANIFYAVIPFANCNGCVFPGAFLDTLTEVSSHELCEAVTDPTLGTWFDPNTGNEIGDICNRQTVRIGNFLVQTEWSNEQTACAFAPLLPGKGSRIDGYQTSFNNQQHVNFIGTDNHVHELFFDNQWHHNDLTLLAAAPPAAPGSHIDGYQTEFNSQQHVNYIGTDNHIHELFFINAWRHNDLTQLTGAPPAAPGSAIDGYETSFNKQQHVNYLGTDNHIHELVFTNAWSHNDLTQLAGAPPAAPGSAIDGYQTEFNSQQHVNYLGADNHVHELFFNNAWHHNDLTQLAAAPPAAPGSAVDGYETSFNQQQHVNYLGTDNHVHELFFNNAWHHNDLTQLAHAPSAAQGSALDGYQTTFNNQQHVNYIGADNHIHELFFISSWSHNDLTQLAKAPAAAPGSPVDGYQTSFNNQQHVNFLGTDNHIHELVFINAWSHNNLTDL